MKQKESRKMLKPYASMHIKNKRTNLFYLILSKKPPRKNIEKRFPLEQNKVTGCVDRKKNEPLNKVEPAERSRPKIAEEVGSRNSGRLGQPETSKNSRGSTQAGRQLDRPKQSHSCRQKVEERVRKNRYASKSLKKEGQGTEKRRRYTSKSGKLQDREGQENLHSKDVSKNHRQPKVNIQIIRANEHVDKTHNCSIYQKIDTRAGYYPLSTHTCLLYTSPSPRDRQKSRMPSSA